MSVFGLCRVIRLRRLIEAFLVIGIVVAYLLVVSRGQIVSTLAGSRPYPAASAAPHPTTNSPSFGVQTP